MRLGGGIARSEWIKSISHCAVGIAGSRLFKLWNSLILPEEFPVGDVIPPCHDGKVVAARDFIGELPFRTDALPHRPE